MQLDWDSEEQFWDFLKREGDGKETDWFEDYRSDYERSRMRFLFLPFHFVMPRRKIVVFCHCVFQGLPILFGLFIFDDDVDMGFLIALSLMASSIILFLIISWISYSIENKNWPLFEEKNEDSYLIAKVGKKEPDSVGEGPEDILPKRWCFAKTNPRNHGEEGRRAYYRKIDR